VAIPKLRQGSYFPEWLLERRKRAERALTRVVATCYLLGVSSRRMDKLVQRLGITTLSKSQVSEMAKELNTHVEEFRTRRLDEVGPFTFLAADALVLKVREDGRVVGVHALLATGVNADGHREILGLHVTTAEDGAGWLDFFRDLVARGLTGVKLVTSDAHAGLVTAIGAILGGAAWQRCRTHYAANLMSVIPKPSWPWVTACGYICCGRYGPLAIRHSTAMRLGSWRGCGHTVPGDRQGRSQSRHEGATLGVCRPATCAGQDGTRVGVG
jgi:putative transposase